MSLLTFFLVKKRPNFTKIGPPKIFKLPKFYLKNAITGLANLSVAMSTEHLLEEIQYFIGIAYWALEHQKFNVNRPHFVSRILV